MVELLDRLNWVDLLALILLIRISYVSSRIGVGKQILPLILLAVILVLTLYYYRDICDFLAARFSSAQSTLRFVVYAAVVSIFFVINYLIFRITGFIFSEEVEGGAIEKVGGAIVGLARSFLIIGIIMIAFLLTPVRFVESSLKNSYSGLFFVKTSLEIYSFLVNPFLKKEKTTPETELTRLVVKKEAYIFESGDGKIKSRFFKKESYE